WEEVKQGYPHFEFSHSHGLGVLAVGEYIPNGLRALIEMPQKDQVLVRQYFANLGTHLTELQSIAIQRANLYELLHAKTEECKRLEAASAANLYELLNAKTKECKRLEAALEAATIELADLRARFNRARYRIVDKVAQVFGKVPLLPRI